MASRGVALYNPYVYGLKYNSFPISSRSVNIHVYSKEFKQSSCYLDSPLLITLNVYLEIGNQLSGPQFNGYEYEFILSNYIAIIEKKCVISPKVFTNLMSVI